MRCWCAAGLRGWAMSMRSGVRLRLNVGMPERFIEKALAAGVKIRDCRREDERSTVICVARRDVAQVREMAEGYGVECEVIGSGGMSAVAEGLLRRRSAFAGVVAMICTAGLLLSRIWMVEVRPVDDAGDALLAHVRQVLAENGAVSGAPVWLDCAQLRAELISAVPEAGYVAVKRRGVCLVAEISQAIAPPVTYDIGAARDVVALYDGVVQRVDVYAGTAAVKPGTTVQRGDLLISGLERTAGEIGRAVSAEGAVIARIWQTAEVQQPTADVMQTPTGRFSVSETLCLPGAELPLTQGQTFACEQVVTEFLPVGGVFLPVGILRSTHIECVEQRTERDPEAVKRLLLEEAEAILDETLPFGARVIDKWEDYSMIDSGIIYMKLTRELEADIAASGRAEK